jgi:hypothetical protein
VISTQQGAVWKSGKGEEPIDVNAPSLPSLNAETVPFPAPPCALETNSWVGSVLLERELPALIVLDVMLPGISARR